jgi:hypothetical protein
MQPIRLRAPLLAAKYSVPQRLVNLVDIRNVDALLHDVLVGHANAVLLVKENTLQRLLFPEKVLFMVTNVEVVLRAHANTMVYAGVAP